MGIELYHADMSTCAQKVRLVLGEKGLEWTNHLLDLRRRDQHAPSYLALNPNGVVPTLVHDGRVVIESTVICEYLDDAFPDPPMRPADPLERARMRIWTKRLDERLHYYTGVLSGSIAFRHQHLARPADELKAYLDGIPDPARRERQRRQIEHGIEAEQFAEALPVFDRFLTDMETQLSETPWLAGASYSLADVAYTPYVIRIDELRLKGWLESRPNLRDWYARIRARPNFGPGYVDWRNDSYVALMNRTGEEAWPRIEAMSRAAPAGA
jgi:glutathione S-transferase